MTELPKTWQELKKRIESAPKPENIQATCICGKHKNAPKMTDENYKELFDILNGEPQTQK